MQQLDNVYVAVEDTPPVGEPRLLGLYEGVPLTQRGGHYGGLPDKITLYRSTIQRGAASEADLVAPFVTSSCTRSRTSWESDQKLVEMGRYCSQRRNH